MRREPETGTEVLIQHNRDASFPAQGTTAVANKVKQIAIQDYYAQLTT